VVISRSIFIGLLLIPNAWPQTGEQSANRAVVAPSGNIPEPAQNGIADKILNMVGPAEPAPLTPQQNFELYLLNTVGPVPLLGEAVGAGYGQWTNAPPEYGQGWAAFGKRYGANLAYNATRQTITYGISLALREDTRYFASRAHGIWPRTRHALVSTFTARRPDGRQEFSVAGTAGVVGACTTSSIWGPGSWKGVDNIAYNAGISFAATAGFNIVREFLPDILRRPRK
jgi:hypothetical protein